MKLCLRILSLLWLLSATLAQDGFDLADALDDLAPAPTPAKPKEQPKPPAPKGDDNFDLFDALGPDPTSAKPKEPPKDHDKPSDGGFNLDDALKPGSDPFADKPVVNPPNSGGGGGGGTFDDSDLLGVGEGGYKPDGGGHGAGGRAVDPGYDPHGGADTPQDPDLLWGQILKMLNANMPEEFYMWISHIRQTLTPLLERAMELLQAMP